MIVLDLPFPVSANAIWGSGRGRVFMSKKYLDWKREADALVMASGAARGKKKIDKDFAISMVLDESKFGRRDADNTIKSTLDYLQRIHLIENDKYLRKLDLEWGETKHGCQVTLRGA